MDSGNFKIDSMLSRYLRRYQEDPKSRAFAPLAEAYRKCGMIDEAISTARLGLRHHPQFLAGRVALCRALFDKKDFLGVVNELEPIIHDVPDNLVAQRLLADSYLTLGKNEKALQTYKFLLYLNPLDEEGAIIVRELEEAQILEEGNVRQVMDARASQGPMGEEKIRKIEFLQTVLQKIERYRAKVSS